MNLKRNNISKINLNFLIFGISNTESLLFNAIEINKLLKLNLIQKTDVEIEIAPDFVKKNIFICFDELKEITYILISNKLGDNYIYDNNTKIDYLFFIYGNGQDLSIKELDHNSSKISLLRILKMPTKTKELLNSILYQILIK